YVVAEVELVIVALALNCIGVEPSALPWKPATPEPGLPKFFPVSTTASPGQPLFGLADSRTGAAEAAGACTAPIPNRPRTAVDRPVRLINRLPRPLGSAPCMASLCWRIGSPPRVRVRGRQEYARIRTWVLPAGAETTRSPRGCQPPRGPSGAQIWARASGFPG